MKEEQDDIIIYNTDDGLSSVVLVSADGMVWLSQMQMAKLFATSKQTVSYHISNILKENELIKRSVVKEILTTATYTVEHYSLDMDNSITETRATCRQADDSRTDGIGATRLSFPIVGFHIDFLAVNHSEVTSDTNRLARLFLTEGYCKALSRAVLFSYGNSHKL